MNKILSAFVIILLVTSCVSKKAHEAIVNEWKEKLANDATLLKEKEDLAAEAVAKVRHYSSIVDSLERQVKRSAREKEATEANMVSMNDLNKVLEMNYNNLIASSSGRNKKLFEQLESKKEELKDKEDMLNLKALEISDLEIALEQREKRVEELESIVNELDSAAKALKDQVLKALYGFNSDEVNVEVEDGKVYVSLSNEILFKSGSATVDAKGIEAVGLLSKILTSDSTIEVNIEGHTDTDKGVDNWDLSVKRATAIVKVLTNATNKVDARRITASGRGEFAPVATNNTAEGKAKNRRIEIILTPNLDAIYQFLGNLN